MKKNTWDISYELEKIVEKKNKGYDFSHTNIIFDRARIESDTFYDVMRFLLFINKSKGADEFCDKYYEIKGKKMSDIPNYEKIFMDFKKIYITSDNEKE